MSKIFLERMVMLAYYVFIITSVFFILPNYVYADDLECFQKTFTPCLDAAIGKSNYDELAAECDQKLEACKSGGKTNNNYNPVINDDPIGMLKNAGDNAGYQTAEENSLTIIVLRIIRAFLGLLGIIAIVLISYAGWLWMTAQGKSERVDQAKTLMVQTVIGMAIVMSGYGITSFIITALVNATTTP